MGCSDHSRDKFSGSSGLPPNIATLIEETKACEIGFFGPDSVMWKINREKVCLLSGVSTLLLQLAHPLVAAGVADHSHFDGDPTGRFRRTFDLVHAIIFGDVDTAIEAALTIRALHTQVTGTLDEDVGSFTVGDTYTASDPELLLWVHSTLIEQSLTAYETYVTPLPESEREEYYQECKMFGQLLGISEERYPATLADFYNYYEQMLSEELTVGIQGKEVQCTLFDQGRMLRPLYTFLGASTLPDPIRTEFHLPWTSWRQRLFDEGAALIRTVLPVLPARLRYVAAYRRARARLQRYEHAEQSASPSTSSTD